MRAHLMPAFLAAGIGLVGIGSVSAASSNGFVIYRAYTNIITLHTVAYKRCPNCWKVTTTPAQPCLSRNCLPHPLLNRLDTAQPHPSGGNVSINPQPLPPRTQYILRAFSHSRGH